MAFRSEEIDPQWFETGNKHNYEKMLHQHKSNNKAVNVKISKNCF